MPQGTLEDASTLVQAMARWFMNNNDVIQGYIEMVLVEKVFCLTVLGINLLITETWCKRHDI